MTACCVWWQVSEQRVMEEYSNRGKRYESTARTGYQPPPIVIKGFPPGPIQDARPDQDQRGYNCCPDADFPCPGWAQSKAETYRH